jgi:hypothetical protein
MLNPDAAGYEFWISVWSTDTDMNNNLEGWDKSDLISAGEIALVRAPVVD